MPKFLNNIDLSQNELQNAILQNLASGPSVPKAGQFYFNTATSSFLGWNGSKWVNLGVEITKANITSGLGFMPLNENLKGVNNGLAELDSSGFVPASQLPSYVDDVKEYTNRAVFPITGESDKIYIDMDTGILYRWSGTTYAEISSTIALGETLQTAYRGDRGKIAYDHSQIAHAPSNAQKNSDITKVEVEAKLTGVIGTHSHTVTKANVGLGNVDNTSDALKPISTATQNALDTKMPANTVLVNKFSQTVGNNSALTFTIPHNLGTKLVTVSLYETATGMEVYTDVERTTINAVKVTFAVKPLLNKYTIVVMG